MLFFRRRSRSRSHHSADRIDKKRLLEIARKNAISMLKNGTLPGTQNLAPEAKEKVLAKMRFGGESKFCLSLRQFFCSFNCVLTELTTLLAYKLFYLTKCCKFKVNL